MTSGAPTPFRARLKALRESAGYTQEELATIAGLSVHAVSALERGERRRPHVETVRALAAALDLTGAIRDAFVGSARESEDTAVEELGGVSLPLSLTALVGRDRDVETLRQWLADPAVRVITLTGPGGVGKTRLALEVAQAIAAEGANRVLFLSLAAIRDPALVAPAIAATLGLSDVTAVDLPKRAKGACGGHATLLVVDNWEQVLDAAPLVADVLASVPSLRVLATSRAPLRVRGEREYPVEPLALDATADALSPADVVRMPAVELFVERVRDVQPDFRLTSANGPAVTAICRRLDALPLALELAAPWMKVLTAEDLRRRLDQDVLLSTVGQRDLPERQQTMNATVAWSYQLLDPEEQRAFRRFGVLPGRFPIDAAAAVLAGQEPALDEADALRAVAALIDKSLLVRTDTSVATRPLFQMLETVRAYAALELAAAGERGDALEGLARHCGDESAAAATGLVGPAQAEWLNRVHDDLDNHRAALAWLIERDRADRAADIAWSLMFFWLIRGLTAEGLRWYEHILRSPSLSPAAASRTLIGASLMRYAQTDIEDARADLVRAMANTPDEAAIVAQAQYMLGRVELATGDMRAARDWLARSLDGFRALGVRWGIGLALNAMAWAELAMGDVGRAERLIDEAMSELRHVGPWFLSAAQNLRAVLAVRRGAPDDALLGLRDSLAHIRNLRDRFTFVYAMAPLAAAAVLNGDDAWAARILGARDAVAESTGAAGIDVDVIRKDAERTARTRLGPDRWADEYAAGRTMSIDEVMQDIDRALNRLAAMSPEADPPAS